MVNLFPAVIGVGNSAGYLLGFFNDGTVRSAFQIAPDPIQQYQAFTDTSFSVTGTNRGVLGSQVFFRTSTANPRTFNIFTFPTRFRKYNGVSSTKLISTTFYNGQI
jgi:hypothetical protein